MRTFVRARRRAAAVGLALAALELAAGGLARAGDVAAPTQPASGPGGADYAHAAVAVQHWGESSDECWVFTPDSPRPKDAPVVVFLHGWGGTAPAIYGAWIRHLVRKGNVVVFPRYQEGMMTLPRESEEHGFAAVKKAMAKLAEGPVTPRPEGVVAIGHSMGGFLAANLAAVGSDPGLPPVRALLCVEPGNKPEKLPVLPRYRYDFEHASRVPADLLAVCLAGDRDTVVGEAGARDIYAKLAHLPREHRDLLLVPSDDTTGLVANHFAPCSFDPRIAGAEEESARGRQHGLVKALDWYAWWKLADGLIDAVYRGRNRDYALGGGDHQLSMGTRSDGTAAPKMRRLEAKEWH